MGSFKKALLFCLAFLPGAALADSQAVGGQWRGLHNSDASIFIEDNEAQDLLNVDISPSATAIKKREGYDQFRTLACSTCSVRGGYYFRDASGRDNLIFTNNQTVYKSTSSIAFSAVITTDTAHSYYDFSDSQGSLWRATNNRDEIAKWNGTTLTYYPSTPKGNQLEFLPDRLVISGTSANPNRLNFSKKADPTTFTAGAEDADPFTTDIGLPGQDIQTIKYALGRLLIWTKTSLSYWYGDSQYNQTSESISTTIGTDQPYTVVTDRAGRVFWQAQDKHFYGYDGSEVARISQALDVSGFATSGKRYALYTSQTEWETGTVGGGLSTTFTPGSVVLTTGTFSETFTDGNYTSNPTWTVWSVFQTTTNIVSNAWKTNVSGGTVNSVSFAIAETTWTYGNAFSVSFTFTGGQSGNGVNAICIYLANATTGLATASVTRSNRLALVGQNNIPDGYSFYVKGNNANAGDPAWFIYKGTAAALGVEPVLVTSKNGTTAYLDGNSHTIDISRTSAGVISLFVDGTLHLRVTDTTNTVFSKIGFLWSFDTTGTAMNSSDFISIDNISSNANTAVYQSPTIDLGTTGTSFGPVTISNILNSGTITYGVYVDSDTSINIFDATTFTSSETVTNGAIPSQAIGRYATFSGLFNRTVITSSLSLDDFKLTWNDSSSFFNYGGIDKDDRLLFAVTEGTNTAPNVTYIYDPRFDAWLKYSFPFTAPVQVEDKVYFGGTGAVYTWPSGNDDNGSAITAYWKSKDFIASDPFIEKDLKSYSFVAKGQAGSNLDIIYTINASSAITNSFSLTADVSGSPFRRVNANLPSGKFGTLFNIRFGNDDSDAPFEIYTIKYDYTPKPWRVLP